jgi:AcrR family transcriptional regulator
VVKRIATDRPRQSRALLERGPRARSNKRALILYQATDHFGRNGYESTKWADVAAAAGLESASLYHYFASKRHLLYEIHAGALETDRWRFDRLTPRRRDFATALPLVLNGLFELSAHDMLRKRVSIAAEDLMSVPSSSEGAEIARRRARGLMSDNELAWATFLIRGMEQRAIPEADPRLLTRALLGLYTSIWEWYGPEDEMTLDELREFFVERLLALAGHGEVTATLEM